MYFGVIMFWFDSSSQNAGSLGQFTYSTSILPCLVWTILQDCVSPFMIILIENPTLNISDVINGHIGNTSIIKRGKGMLINSEGIV